ncbi:MAG: DNA mismatch repair protein MutS [Candidatus Omnitrophica bacterium]|nr:DNA mismatch repair protein MutS [Candidatus Omnitrophota bacterium]
MKNSPSTLDQSHPSQPPEEDDSSPITSGKDSPMLRQYHAIKAKHQDCVLFFRLGDFYEMFYDDAKVVSRILDLVLTARGKAPSQRIPMCGFPHHAAENYIARLVKAGFKIAICEQTEDPSKAKGIVKRDVIRIISAGSYLDEQESQSRYMLSLFTDQKLFGFSLIDTTTGTIETNQFSYSLNRLIEITSRLPIYECVYPFKDHDHIKSIFNEPLLKHKNITLSPYDDWCFNPDIAKKNICAHFGTQNLNGFRMESLDYAIASTGALLEYLKHLNKQPLRHIDRISLYSDSNFAYISPAAQRGLEIEQLVKALDQTHTALGKRLFRFWVYHPLKNKEEILKRQDAVRLLKEHNNCFDQLHGLLDQIPDLEKNISRLSCGYTHAKDFLALRNTLNLIPDFQSALKPIADKSPYFLLHDIQGLRGYLDKTIAADIPLSKPEGKIIREGVHLELDELRALQKDSTQWMKNFQADEIRKTGINSLKVGFNKVFGYYIEVTKTHSKNVPEHYIRKQTLVNAERYITPELKTYEEKILTAQDKILQIELSILTDVLTQILDCSKDLHIFCQRIAQIDAILGLACVAKRKAYQQPNIKEDLTLTIIDGRHPVVEQVLTDGFIPNDTQLDTDDSHLIILTGPNMAGKSTYIRQTALLVIMAQIGSWVPVKSADIGLVDKIFTRIGAHDDIMKGQSTFMVEMNEAADILNNLTERSLIILDEIGRGTSTYDGLSLAWSLAEFLHTKKARTLFATHFHELTALADQRPGIKNYNVAVKEWKDEIVFLHKIVPGSSDDSYGIYVAKLAGIHEKVISRAKQILSRLEMSNNIKEDLKGSCAENQLTLFDQTRDPAMDELKDALAAIDVNTLTPLDALLKIKELKDKLNH